MRGGAAAQVVAGQGRARELGAALEALQADAISRVPRGELVLPRSARRAALRAVAHDSWLLRPEASCHTGSFVP